jgi:hypothetical protein
MTAAVVHLLLTTYNKGIATLSGLCVVIGRDREGRFHHTLSTSLSARMMAHME